MKKNMIYHSRLNVESTKAEVPNFSGQEPQNDDVNTTPTVNINE